MTEKEEKFIKQVNIDKAKNKVIVSIILIVISILTYILPLMFGEFDFGLLFEIASLVFLIIAKNYMSKYDENKSKRYIICSMLSIGWILIYDLLIFCTSIQDVVDLAFLGFDYYFAELLSILYLMVLFAINRDLSKADNPTKYKESTDWFYEKYEKKEDGGNSTKKL